MFCPAKAVNKLSGKREAPAGRERRTAGASMPRPTARERVLPIVGRKEGQSVTVAIEVDSTTALFCCILEDVDDVIANIDT